MNKFIARFTNSLAAYVLIGLMSTASLAVLVPAKAHAAPIISVRRCIIAVTATTVKARIIISNGTPYAANTDAYFKDGLGHEFFSAGVRLQPGKTVTYTSGVLQLSSGSAQYSVNGWTPLAKVNSFAYC